MTTFTGEEFVKAMSSKHGLPIPIPPLTLTGLVKPLAADLPDGVLFSPGASCSVWLPIPTRMIEKVDHLGKVPCIDHEHDLVRIHFKLPTSDEGRVLADLLRHQEALANSGIRSTDAESGQEDFNDPNTLAAMALMDDPSGPASLRSPSPLARGGFDRIKCARCVVANLALATAMTAALVAFGPASPGVVPFLMTKFGISEALAIAIVGGLSGAGLAKKLCGKVC